MFQLRFHVKDAVRRVVKLAGMEGDAPERREVAGFLGRAVPQCAVGGRGLHRVFDGASDAQPAIAPQRVSRVQVRPGGTVNPLGRPGHDPGQQAHRPGMRHQGG